MIATNLRRLRQALHRARGFRWVRLGGVRCRVDPDHPAFWTSMDRGEWEPQTFAVLDRFVAPGSVVYDIGAWIGPVSLYAASLGAQVVSVEPDPVAYRFLLWNLQLNDAFDRVMPLHLAVGGADGIVSIQSRGWDLGDSMTTVVPASASAERLERSARAPMARIDEIQGRLDLPTPGFVKIDIEGGEFDLMPRLGSWIQRHRPVVYLSTHGTFLDAANRAATERALEAIEEVFGEYTTWLRADDLSQPIRSLAAAGAVDRLAEFLFVPEG